MHRNMKRYLSYCTAILAMFFASCMNLTEGLNEADVLVVSTKNIEMDNTGGESTIEVDAYCSWKVSSTEEWSWITTTATKGEKGKSQFKLVISENNTAEDRTATITVENKTYEVTHEIAVLQKAGSPYIQFSKDHIEATSDGVEEMVIVDSNIDYTISSSAEWCVVNASKGESGQMELNIKVNPSPTTAERTATLTFKNAARNCESTLTVKQSSFQPSLEVSDSQIESLDLGLEKEITITSNVAWVATCEANWVALSAVNGEAGRTTVTVTIQKNADVSGREAKVVVSNSEYGLAKEITLKQLPILPAIEVSETDIEATEEGRAANFTVTSNIPWTVTCSETWITITPANGMKGTNTVQVTIDRNTTTEVRNATILVSNSEYEIAKEVAVSQLAFGPGLEVSDSQITASSEGLTKDITVTSNIEWNAVCDANWITLSSVNGKEGSKTITVTVANNNTTSARSAVIVVRNNEYNLTQEVTVSQEAFAPVLTVSDSQINATEAGLQKNLTIEANIPWNAVCDANWITLSAANGTSSNREFVVTVANNATQVERSATISVSNTEYGIVRNITVSQSAFVVRFTISNQELSFGCVGETKDITIDTNLGWTAICREEWISLSPVNGNATDGLTTLSITAADNYTTSAREGIIVIANNEHQLTAEISVTQEAFTPELAIVGESSITLDYMAGTHNVAVRSNLGYTATTDADWLNIEQTTEGIRLTYSTNLESTDQRTAVVNITASEYDNLECVLNVTQAGYSEYNTIHYTSTGGLVMPNTSDFGVNIIAVTCDGGEGVIRFDGPVTRIGDNAFKNCTELTSIILPTTVLNIGSSAFLGCSALESVEINSGLTAIGSRAFSGCSSLTEMNLPEGLTTIAENTFYNCTSLASVNIPSGVTTIGAYAFQNCSELANVSIPEGVTTINEYAFAGCSSIESMNIPSSVTSLGGNAFANCSSLESVTLPSDLTSISTNAFYGCTALESISIPSTVTSIGSYAFASTGLENLTIPASVRSIGEYALSNCSSLNTVICMSSTVPTGATKMFGTVGSSFKIYVPTGCSNKYKTASYWSTYSEYIYDIEYTPTECTSLTITAEDVRADATNTIITYTAMTNGTTPFGTLSGIEVTGRVQSENFPANTSEEDVEVTISFTYMGVTATTTITQHGVGGRYTVVLNDQWRLSTSVTNPDESLYDGVYESNSNYHVNYATATMYIDIEGYETFEVYIRSYAESRYDYVTISQLDNTTNKATTSSNQTSGSSISNYTKVTYTGIDKGAHRITIKYIKDGSNHSNNDRGYVLIPKNQ